MTLPIGQSARVAWRRVLTFYLIACALAWLAALPLWVSGRGLDTPASLAFLLLMMFTPAASALIVTLRVEHRGFGAAMRRLGIWPLGRPGRVLGFIAIGIFGSIAVVIAGVFLAAALGFLRLDLVSFSGFAKYLHGLTGTSIPIPIDILAIATVASYPLNAVFTGFAALGEEAGWRGWMLPALRPLGDWPALLITGVAWGLWHTPVILLGYNFSQPNLFGVVLMTVGCSLFGVLVGWLRIASDSVWPSAFAHGAFNTAATFSVVVSAAAAPVDPVVSNPLGWPTWIVFAVIIAVLALTGRLPAGKGCRRWSGGTLGLKQQDPLVHECGAGPLEQYAPRPPTCQFKSTKTQFDQGFSCTDTLSRPCPDTRGRCRAWIELGPRRRHRHRARARSSRCSAVLSAC